MFHVEHSPEFCQIRDSIGLHGPFLPVYYYGGRVLDGSKRARACLETGRDFARVELPDEASAARLLWSLHPARAWETFAKGKTLVAFCQLSGARPSECLRFLPPAPSSPKYITTEHRRRLYARVSPATGRRIDELCGAFSCGYGELVDAALAVVIAADVGAKLTAMRLTARKGRGGRRVD